MIKDVKTLLSQEINKFENKYNKSLTVTSYDDSNDEFNHFNYLTYFHNKKGNLISFIEVIVSKSNDEPNINDISNFVNNFAVLFNPRPQIEGGVRYNLRTGEILQDYLVIVECAKFKCPQQLPKLPHDPRECDLVGITYHFAFNLQRKLNDLVDKEVLTMFSKSNK